MENIFWSWEDKISIWLLFAESEETQSIVRGLRGDKFFLCFSCEVGQDTVSRLEGVMWPAELGSALVSPTDRHQSLFLGFSFFCFWKDENQLLIALLTSDAWSVLVKMKVLVTQSCPTLCDPVDCLCNLMDWQAPLCMEFPRQKYWSGLPFPSPGYLPDPGIKLGSPALQADSLPSEPPVKPCLS